MPGRLRSLMFRGYGRLPRGVRRMIIRVVAPSYNVGAMTVIQRDDGALLLVRNSYRGGWGAPGGLLHRKEEPAAGARREAEEEIGVAIELQGKPTVMIDARARRIDVVFRGEIGPPVPDVIKPNSAEIVEAGWFQPDRLPILQREMYEALVEMGVLERRESPQGATGREP